MNVLSIDQKDLSDFFAKRLAQDPDHELAGISYRTGQTDSPLIEGAFAYFDCKLHATYPGGDHTIYLGEVVDVSESDEREPLLFWRGTYCKVDLETVT